MDIWSLLVLEIPNLQVNIIEMDPSSDWKCQVLVISFHHSIQWIYLVPYLAAFHFSHGRVMTLRPTFHITVNTRSLIAEIIKSSQLESSFLYPQMRVTGNGHIETSLSSWEGRCGIKCPQHDKEKLWVHRSMLMSVSRTFLYWHTDMHNIACAKYLHKSVMQIARRNLIWCAMSY